MNDTDKDRHALGMAARRGVLGDAHVDRAEAAKTAFDAPFHALITEAAWGHVWSRPDWTQRERSMVTIALPVASQPAEDASKEGFATRLTPSCPTSPGAAAAPNSAE